MTFKNHVRASLGILGIFVFAMLVGAALAPDAFACDPGNFYDPDHGICQNTPPYNPRPGFGYQPSNDPYPRGGYDNPYGGR
jgi:hypothetical protein